ncbi:MAG: CHAT domain-containing protein [Candidatus Krumholzibacteriota bacterium]|nr:CHAT domain-containing protein [Candidatus Krumholzibacteriota bacterium]
MHSAPRQRIALAILILAAGAAAGFGPVHAARVELPPLQRDFLTRVDSLWAAGEGTAARAAVDSLLPRARSSGDSLFLEQLLSRRGAWRASYGEAKVAEPDLREAVALAEALDDSAALCSAVRWLSVAVGQRGRAAETVALHRRLLDLALALNDRAHEGWAHVGLGWDAIQAGRLEDSAAHYREAAGIFRELDEHQGEIWARNGLGIALQRLGSHREAAAVYEETAARARAIGYRLVEAFALNNLGGIEYSLGDPGLAEDHFRRAHDIQQELGHRREAVTPLTNVALCQIHFGRFDEAEAALCECQADCEAGGWPDLQARVLDRLGGVAVRRQRPREAARIYRRALALPELPAKERVNCLVGLSEALAAADSTQAALAVLESSEVPDLAPGSEQAVLLAINRGERLLALGRHREALTPLRAAADAAEAGGLQEGYRLRALARAARCLRALGLPDEALATLRRASDAWEAERSLPLDPEWREVRGTYGRLIYTDLADLLLQAPAGGSAAAFDALQAYKARTLRERMLGPGGGSAVPDAPAATLTSLQTVLRPGERFLDAYLGPERSLLFTVDPGSVGVRELPPAADLERRLRRFHGFLTAPASGGAAGDPAATAAVAARLAALLLGEAPDRLAGIDHVIVSPDGALNLLPFNLLSKVAPADDACRAAPDAARGRAPVWTRVPSAAVLIALRAARDGRDPPRRGLALACRRGPAGDPLPGAVGEARDLARRFRDIELRILPSAEGAAVAGELGAYGLLHLAAHSLVDDEHPWRSAIHLGGEGGDLLAADVATLRLPARLAVLSGCESAGGRVLDGEGVLGLGSAFLAAGVPTVVASLWPVDDAATRRLMARFYEELADGGRAGAALARAQDALRAEDRYAHPFYWAGFVVLGDGGRPLPLARRLGSRWLASAGVLVLLFLVAWDARRRRRNA